MNVYIVVGQKDWNPLGFNVIKCCYALCLRKTKAKLYLSKWCYGPYGL
jgi:hypothetical protein